MNLIDLIPTLTPQRKCGEAFAPSNIALCKYWGKRNTALNLPVTSSLSISLGEKGTKTRIALSEMGQDVFTLNGEAVSMQSSFAKRLSTYLDAFRAGIDTFYRVETESNIPVAAGLASSASGFAALIKALDAFYEWELNDKTLSILARYGSGSASRSLWQGFVEWRAGTQDDGLDCYAKPLKTQWSEFRIGLLILSGAKKSIGSREAMQRTVETSPFYQHWPSIVEEDMQTLRGAIKAKDFETVGKTAESNAIAMHATMTTAWPPVNYCLPETIAAMNQVWALRGEGVPLYFTQDAGPNLKLLFLDRDVEVVKEAFSSVEVITPFKSTL